MSVQAPRRLFTVDQFYQMAEAGILREDDRVELLNGEVVEMTPIGSRHAACVDRLERIFHDRVDRSISIRVQGPVRLDELSEPQPDIALLRFRSDFYADAHPGPGDVLLVVEVADTSADLDRAVKVPLYARAGIPEVWLIDLAARAVDVYQNPSAESYGQYRRLQVGDRLVPAGCSAVDVAVSDILA